jgi:hypothetical protein
MQSYRGGNAVGGHQIGQKCVFVDLVWGETKDSPALSALIFPLFDRRKGATIRAP